VSTLVEISGLSVHFTLKGSALSRVLGRSAPVVRAVDGVDLSLRRGEVLGLVGESGSGKTTLGRAVLGLVPASAGSIRFDGTDVTALSERRIRPLRRRMQMVFQDPHAALNPAMDLGTAIGHPLRIHKLTTGERETRERVHRVMELVGLAPAERYYGQYPADLSGGQKQRAVLARAAILEPELIVADEPVSMLDMSVRARTIELMADLKERLDLTYVYITHDLATAKLFCDRIAIMYLGRIVEIGPTAEIFADPKHPYTRALLRAVPEPDPDRRTPRDLPRGEIPDASRPPAGCAFHPRCPMAFEPCGWTGRDLRAHLEDRWTRRGEEVYEREHRMFAGLDRLGDQTEAVLVPHRLHTARDLVDLLATARRDAPDDPFWRGVLEVGERDGNAIVRFAGPVVPTALARPGGSGQVACHLHHPS
jgi:oligopeptide/dipeptide ABC transporter ATP-binding protein